MDGLTPGRLVHVVLHGENNHHRPAVVVEVHNDRGLVNLQVFLDGTNDKKAFEGFSFPPDTSQGLWWATSISYSETKEPGTWHWIEKA